MNSKIRGGIFLCLSIIHLLYALPLFSDCIDELYFQTGKKTPAGLISQRGAYPQKITKVLQGITFDSDYDNGSLENVTESDSNVFNCTIYTDSGELGAAQYWFRFRMSGVAGRTITLNIDHGDNPRPVVRFGTGGPWRRMTSTEAPSTARIIVTAPADVNEAELAFFFPSGFGETCRKVNDFVRASDDATSSLIGLSFQGREMLMLNVTDRNATDTGKHRVWVHSRAHAGEVTATLLMLGFLEQITGDSYTARRLRRFCIFNIVPLQNVDGVFLGHTRWDSQGIDPERQWPDPYRIPEVGNIKDRVDAFMTGENPIEVALNMHSTRGNFTDTYFIKHIRDSVTEAFEEKEQKFINAFKNATPLFNNLSPHTSQLEPVKFIESYFWNNWGEAVMAMTHEGHFYRRITDNAFLTDEDYYELGRAMARSMIEYFNLPPIPYETTGWMLY
jgi:hypothetical protein